MLRELIALGSSLEMRVMTEKGSVALAVHSFVSTTRLVVIRQEPGTSYVLKEGTPSEIIAILESEEDTKEMLDTCELLIKVEADSFEKDVPLTLKGKVLKATEFK